MRANPEAEAAYAELIQETIFGTNIGVKEGRITREEAQALVDRAIFYATLSVLLNLSLETGSNQTKELETEWKKINPEGIPQENLVAVA